MNRSQVPGVGDTASDFVLSDSSGNQRKLSDFVKASQSVVIFYRGHW
jgi:peroxiredoxin